MKILITGTSSGIGEAIARKFISEGHEVHGIDRKKQSFTHDRYTHHVADVSMKETLPDIESVNILINDAGVQNEGENDIRVNLMGTINVTEKYAFQKCIKSVLNIASASAHTGAEFPEYSASKGGILAYTKNAAIRLAKYKATCNSISPGGVLTSLNKCVIEDKALWKKIMALTPLKRWATPEEIATWCYFVTVVNSFCTGQDFLIDGGESTDAKFIWKS